VITESEPVAIKREYITDATYVPRLARAFTAFAMSRPAFVWTFGTLGVIGILCIVIGLGTGHVALVAGGLVYVVFVPLMALITYRRTSRGNALRIPPGSLIAATLGTDSLLTQGPLGTSDANYRAYKAVYRRGDFVILQSQGLRIYAILPIELFPGSDFDRLRAAIEKANA
jgi:hypothetical protein